MGRAPCCDKANVKKGPWSPEEDAKLKSYIEQHGTGGNWIALPQKIGLKRCGKSCRLRWLNYLRPNIRHGGFSEEEDNIICSLYISIGSRWSVIAAQLPGRTDNDIKNYWNTRLKKKLLGKQRKEQQARRGSCAAAKQEMKRGISGTALISDNDSSSPYWPELPVPAALAPYPNEEEQPRINDHSSIRRLLIRLGGRFSDDEQQQLHNGSHNLNFQLPVDNISTIQQPYINDHSVNFLASAPMNSMSSTALNNPSRSEFDEYNIEGGGGLQMLQGQNSFLAELEEMVCSNPQRLDGLEFLYPQDMANQKAAGSTGNYGQGLSWGETSSTMAYPPPVVVASSCGYNDHDQLRYSTQQ